MCKSHFFLKFQVLCEWSSDITSFVESNVCSILKVENVWILFVDFHLTIVAQISCPNLICYWTSGCSFMSKSYLLLNFSKEASIYIYFLKHPVYSSFDVQSVLIRYCCFYFVASYPNYTCNSTCHILGARVLGVLRKKERYC